MLPIFIFICGIGHLLLCIASLIIPKALGWKQELSKVKPLIRQMFWTYAAYILVINACFGIVSTLGTEELTNHSFLATCITFFIFLYWCSRILIQFLYFDKTDAPKGILFTLGEIGLVSLFFFFTIVYGWAFIYNLSWIN